MKQSRPIRIDPSLYDELIKVKRTVEARYPGKELSLADASRIFASRRTVDIKLIPNKRRIRIMEVFF